MNNIKVVLLIVPLLAFAYACALEPEDKLVLEPGSAMMTVSTGAAPWQGPVAVPLYSGMKSNIDLALDPGRMAQEIDGFGGAFNEQGWMALAVLTPAERETVLAALFDPADGLKLGFGRVPIGASDYARDLYTLNETQDDFDMSEFSIARDRADLIPYIRLALQFRPDVRLWGSAWTPPTWMKTTGLGTYKGGSMRDDAGCYAAYALYLARFVEAYRAEGLDVFAVAVQNEPTVTGNYPSCAWSPEQYRVFIRDHLGPCFQARTLDADIMLGTICAAPYDDHPRTVLADGAARGYVDLVGFQMQGLEAVAATRHDYPDLRLMQTETECGNNWWEAGYQPDRPPNDWAYGSLTWKKVKAFFEAGVNSYMLWNMVLDEFGKNINPEKHWPQNAAVVVEQATARVVYTPMFFAFKHYSFFVQPGARLLAPDRLSPEAIAFLNPDGSIVIVAENDSASPRTLKAPIRGVGPCVTLPAHSWSTIVVPGS